MIRLSKRSEYFMLWSRNGSTDEMTLRILGVVSDASGLSKLGVDQFTDLFVRQ